MPILTYKSNGFSVSAAVLLQVEVHIQQQVLEHAAWKQEAQAATAEIPG